MCNIRRRRQKSKIYKEKKQGKKSKFRWEEKKTVFPSTTKRTFLSHLTTRRLSHKLRSEALSERKKLLWEWMHWMEAPKSFMFSSRILITLSIFLLFFDFASHPPSRCSVAFIHVKHTARINRRIERAKVGRRGESGKWWKWKLGFSIDPKSHPSYSFDIAVTERAE